MLKSRGILVMIMLLGATSAFGRSYRGKVNIQDGDIDTVARAKEAVRLLAQETCTEDGFGAISYGVEIISEDGQDLYRGTFQCLDDESGMERVSVYTVSVEANGDYLVVMVPQQFQSVQ